jgi:hypothetical protein
MNACSDWQYVIYRPIHDTALKSTYIYIYIIGQLEVASKKHMNDELWLFQTQNGLLRHRPLVKSYGYLDVEAWDLDNIYARPRPRQWSCYLETRQCLDTFNVVRYKEKSMYHYIQSTASRP